MSISGDFDAGQNDQMPAILLATPDKDLNSELFGALFSNYELEVVTTGWEAMTKCEEQAFDIVIVYADLPGLEWL